MSRIFYFEIHRAPSELLLPSAKNLPRKAELARHVCRYTVADYRPFTVRLQLKTLLPCIQLLTPTIKVQLR